MNDPGNYSFHISDDQVERLRRLCEERVSFTSSIGCPSRGR